MARQGQQNAQNTYNTSSDLTKTASGNANNLYGTLVPAYTAEATNPTGIGATGMADLNTATQQSTGGGLAADVGKAKQDTAAAHNLGGVQAGLDEASRQAEQQHSNDTLAVQNENQNLKTTQQQEGLAGLSNLYGIENGDVLSSLGLQNAATNAQTQAGSQGWLQNTTGILSAIRGAGASSNGAGGWSITG